MRYAVIMAGGAGTRLWPLSTARKPKQLIPFIDGRCLLEIAADRLKGLIDPERQFIGAGEQFRQAIRQAVPRFPDERIIGEPAVRDTLPAMGLAAALVARHDDQAVIAVFTADHLIEPIDIFRQRVRTGFEIAERLENTLVTFGIRPTHPATGYGYVQLGEPLPGFEHAHTTVAFKEKPDRSTAERYVASDRYLWNSGMFVWRSAALLDCIQRYEPSVHEGLMAIAGAWDTPRRRQVLDEVYPKLKKISVDFAVMEPASKDEAVKLATVTMPVQWLDVGGWPAFAETLEPDDRGNRTAAARALAADSRDNLILSDDEDHLIATLGVEDLIIVHTGRATLICHRDAAERIKDLHQQVRERFGDEYI